MATTQPTATIDPTRRRAVGRSADRSDWPQIDSLRELGALFYERGWSVGTSSNYSVVLSRQPLRLLITASGRDKRRLSVRDFVVVDDAGTRVEPSDLKPSAETLLHLVIAQQPGVAAVLHTHSVWSTILSDLCGDDGGVSIEGYEMLKGLAGVSTHEHRQWVEVFENNQDLADLAARVAQRLADPARPFRHGFLLRRHGLYTWGRSLDEARRHVEIFEFLFEVVGRRIGMDAARPDGPHRRPPGSIRSA